MDEYSATYSGIYPYSGPYTAKKPYSDNPWFTSALLTLADASHNVFSWNSRGGTCVVLLGDHQGPHGSFVPIPLPGGKQHHVIQTGRSNPTPPCPTPL